MTANLTALILLAWLLPDHCAQAEPASDINPLTRLGLAREDEEFASLLKGSIRICKGVARPAPTEYVLMPFLAANAAKFKGHTVLDIGTGSGILALYAAQLGAAKVIATDIEPLSISCARENARRLGLDSVVQARLVSMRDTTAFSVIRPEETFDIIVSIPPNEADRTPFAVAGSIDESPSPSDTVKLGLSIVNGLGKHLGRDGAAVLLYDSVVEHNIMVGYARHMGFAVEHHPALEIHGTEWCALYNTFAAKVAHAERIDPGALLLTRATCDAGAEHYVNVDRAHAAFPPLWGKDFNQIFPGMIVIRNKRR